ncbi:hypothetical protein FIBSPDRAFT_942119 [Athelia psychrophila]|uniref:Uncharacterized protein n=1 Tax=Athelia psychrophila TaxID=1759441 RepID=A0A167SV63_9AGAM|nr:hypothetical protein FIBSPDRAFT_942119 [Fibularhizoctonia sp. CBS 109695]
MLREGGINHTGAKERRCLEGLAGMRAAAGGGLDPEGGGELDPLGDPGVQKETLDELEDLVSALGTACSSPRFPNLRTATFRVIHPNKTSIRRLLNILSNIRHATMCLSPSHKEYSLVFKPANSQATLSRFANIPSLEKVELLFTTENSLQEFIDVAAIKKGGFKTIHASPATIYELCASGIWTMMPMVPQLCNKTRDPLHSHAHIVCEGDEFTELCLVVARGPDMRWAGSEGLTSHQLAYSVTGTVSHRDRGRRDEQFNRLDHTTREAELHIIDLHALCTIFRTIIDEYERRRMQV